MRIKGFFGGFGLALLFLIALTYAQSDQKGLMHREPGAMEGYTLFTPLRSTSTYLVDMEGKVAHVWPSKYPPGQSVYLMDNGDILRATRNPDSGGFRGGGIGGRIQRIDWDGKVVWDFLFADQTHCQHHDIEPLPNGNILVLAWERKTKEEAITAGRNPELLRQGELWPDYIVEITPEPPDGGKIVWEWHTWDHLVQDFDKSKKNHGVIRDHPELIDVNYTSRSMQMSPAEAQRLRGLGYIEDEKEDEGERPRPPHPEDAARPREGAGRESGGGGSQGGPLAETAQDQGSRPVGQPGDAQEPAAAGADQDRGPRRPGGSSGPGGPGGFGFGGPGGADWQHTNAIDYNPKLDQIILSGLNFNEIWIIDHSTTTAESAGHKGGRSGKGGDLLYRWGNPQAYGRGSSSDQRLFGQHDAQWIETGLPGAGHLLLFNNGRGRPGGDLSSVDKIETPLNSKGGYDIPDGKAFAPSAASWSFVSSAKLDFTSGHVSGVQRLANGNTLICDGEGGRIIEITPEGKKVWDYVNPHGGEVGMDGPGWPGPFGRGPGMGPPPGGQPPMPGGGQGGPPNSDGRPGGGPPTSDGPPNVAPSPGDGPVGPPAGSPGMGPPNGGPGQGGRPGGFGRGGGPGEPTALFRATRIPADHPGLSRLRKD